MIVSSKIYIRQQLKSYILFKAIKQVTLSRSTKELVINRQPASVLQQYMVQFLRLACAVRREPNREELVKMHSFDHCSNTACTRFSFSRQDKWNFHHTKTFVCTSFSVNTLYSWFFSKTFYTRQLRLTTSSPLPKCYKNMLTMYCMCRAEKSHNLMISCLENLLSFLHT